MEIVSILEKFKELSDVRTVGVRFISEHGTTRMSYAELIDKARHFAASLRERGVKQGEPVILLFTVPENAVIAILGCMIAGCPPAPIYPPATLQALGTFFEFMKHVAERSRAALIVADSQPFKLLGASYNSVGEVRGVERFDRMIASRAADLSTDASEMAFLQFTSGSTGAPKGVIVTYDSLAANLCMIRECAHMDSTSCVVTWLPVYHDMGLIGTVLNAITLPCELVVLPPMLFLKKPRMWLEAISEFGGTHTAAPNFAYGLSVKRVHNPEGLNLSRMTTFICGAEPVLPVSMRNFVKHYEKSHLNPHSLVPAYGLAEATLAVTFTPFLRGLLTDEVDVSQLANGKALRPDSGARSVSLASCGTPMPRVHLRIAGEAGERKSEREVGEIQLQGPSVTPGYINDQPSTRESRTADGWLKTGDLGYIANGELYVCGRIKDVIIVRGRNYYAHDIESIASEVHGVRVGNVVAFGVQHDSGESLIVVAESREEKSTQEIAREIRGRIAERIGITPEDVVIVPPGTLPKTSSGKLKRVETRRLYETESLQKGKFQELQSAIQSGLTYLKGRLGM